MLMAYCVICGLSVITLFVFVKGRQKPIMGS